jgi:hypothetical protein
LKKLSTSCPPCGITAKVKDEPVTSGNEIEVGSIVEFTTAPNNGYLVNEWQHDGAVVFNNNTNTFLSFTMPNLKNNEGEELKKKS